MIYEDLLPIAMECGIGYKDFFKMTPKAITYTIDGFSKRRKNAWEKAEYESWLTGYYVLRAIGCAFSKKNQYPKNPMQEETIVVEDMELTEDEKQMYTEKLFDKLIGMMEKHENHKTSRK